MLKLILTLILLIITTLVSAQTQHDTIDVAILGDSNTWLGGDDCTKPKGWNTYFKAEFKPRSCVSLARSGASWTHTPQTVRNTAEYAAKPTPNNVIYNQVERLKEKVDSGKIATPNLIIIACGTNDGWFRDRYPNLFDTFAPAKLCAYPDSIILQPVNKMLSLGESVLFNCTLLQKYFPKARIILLSPMQTTAVPLSVISDIGNIIEEIGKFLCISTIRQDKICCVKSADERVKKVNTYDGTHTSQVGAQKNGKVIALEISKLLTQNQE